MGKLSHIYGRTNRFGENPATAAVSSNLDVEATELAVPATWLSY